MMDGMIELSEEDRIAAEEERARALQGIATVLIEKRKEALDHEQQSGFDKIWTEDEEFYDGIDDANRASMMTKGQSAGSPVQKSKKKPGQKSTIFVNITQPYVDMAAARLADLLLPTGEAPFKVDPTPMPDVSAVIDSPEGAEPVQAMGPDGQPVATTMADAAKQMLDQAKKCAEKAQKRVWDWWVESEWQAEKRKVIKAAAKIGTGVLKGPFPVKRKAKKITTVEGVVKLEIMEKLSPASKEVSARDIFPDPSCGDCIHKGSWLFERERMTSKQLRELIGTKVSSGEPMYLDSEIEAVLEEGPDKCISEPKRGKMPSDQYEVWYFYGQLTGEDLQTAGFDVEKSEAVNVIMMMVNDRVCMGAESYLDSGEFPFDVMVWQPVTGTWKGKGVGRQVRVAQQIVNGAARNLMDNAGVSSGPQLVFREGHLEPVNGEYSITGLKLWRLREDSDMKAVDALAAIEIPSMQEKLMAIIDMGRKIAEEAASIPLIMQGQQGAATETVGGMTILDANASTVLRDRCKTSDDKIVVPHVKRYYEYLLLHSENPEEKGDFQIQALGTAVFYQRDAQAQEILNMQPMLADPEFRFSKPKFAKEYLKSRRLMPENFQHTDDEWKQIEAQMQQNPPKDPRIAVAEINSKTKIEAAKMDMDRDTVYEQQASARATELQDYNLKKLALEKEIALMRENGEMARKLKDSEDKLEAIKADLAKVTMQLQTQVKLSKVNSEPGTKQVKKPPTEPKGRAPDGQAYQR